MGETIAALRDVQSILKAPKNQFNSFGKYNYRSCEDILEAAKPLCVEHGLLLTLSDEVVCVGQSNYVKATATITGEDGHSISTSAYAREAVTKKGMDDSQITGSSSSYARKYALNGLFCIDDTKDADTEVHSATDSGKSTGTKNVGKAVKPLKDQAIDVIKASGWPPAKQSAIMANIDNPDHCRKIIEGKFK